MIKQKKSVIERIRFMIRVLQDKDKQNKHYWKKYDESYTITEVINILKNMIDE